MLTTDCISTHNKRDRTRNTTFWWHTMYLCHCCISCPADRLQWTDCQESEHSTHRHNNVTSWNQQQNNNM